MHAGNAEQHAGGRRDLGVSYGSCGNRLQGWETLPLPGFLLAGPGLGPQAQASGQSCPANKLLPGCSPP